MSALTAKMSPPSAIFRFVMGKIPGPPRGIHGMELARMIINHSSETARRGFHAKSGRTIYFSPCNKLRRRETVLVDIMGLPHATNNRRQLKAEFKATRLSSDVEK